MCDRPPLKYVYYCALLSVVSFLQFVKCDEDNDDPDPDDDDGIDIELGTGAIIGIVIGIVALLIAVPILLCFCCGCLCFKKKQKIIGVTPSASATLRKQHASRNVPTEIGMEGSDKVENRRLSLNTPPQRRDSQFSGATAPPGQEFTPYPLDDNLGTFYYNLGFEPPPPYAFSGEDFGPDGIRIRYSDAAWTTGDSRVGSARPSIDAGGTSKLGPSAIKGRLA